jgi:hypothetical protein
MGCSALKSVLIPNSVTEIGAAAFRSCTGLTSLIIPASVTAIYSDAWWGCDNIQTITAEWLVPLSLTANIFAGINTSICPLKVPIGTSNLYKEANIWNRFKIVEEYDVTGINDIQVNKLTIYPNPTQDKVYIQTESESALQVKVFNTIGKLLLETRSNEIDLSAFAKGIYLIQVNGKTTKIEKK